jgi:hypothetical protein
MQVNVDINPEEVNRQVASMIINSALGQKLKDEIEKQVGEIVTTSYYSNSVVKRVVEEQVYQIVHEILMAPEYRDKLKLVVRTWLEEKFTDEVLGKLLEKVWEKILEN